MEHSSDEPIPYLYHSKALNERQGSEGLYISTLALSSVTVGIGTGGRLLIIIQICTPNLFLVLLSAPHLLSSLPLLGHVAGPSGPERGK
jgi:hypothetical protein